MALFRRGKKSTKPKKSKKKQVKNEDTIEPLAEFLPAKRRFPNLQTLIDIAWQGTALFIAIISLFVLTQINIFGDEPSKSNPFESPVAIPTPIPPEALATGEVVFDALLTENDQPTIYVVQAGDVPLTIAARFGVSVEALMQKNGIYNPHLLQIGQVLVIPVPGQATSVAVGGSFDYSIQAGDTFLILARRYNISLESIESLNPGVDSRYLQIGQIIRLPGQGSASNQVIVATPTKPVSTAPVNPPQNIEQLNWLEQSMFNSVNAQRAANGLPAYQLHPTLNGTARAHAQDMVNRGYFSHTTLEGVTLRERLVAAGLDVAWSGENIQRNTRPADESVQYAMNWFMQSTPHRNNILHEQYTHLGVGAVEGPPGWFTFVLNFASE